jgi:hypothetical protein
LVVETNRSPTPGAPKGASGTTQPGAGHERDDQRDANSASTDPTMAITSLWATAVVVSMSFFAVTTVYVF